MKPKLLWYCTKARPYLIKNRFSGLPYLAFKELEQDVDYAPQLERIKLNGKIACVSDYEVEEVMTILNESLVNVLETPYTTNKLCPYSFLKRSCLKKADVDKYKPNYAIHIKNLEIFDKPKGLKDLYIKGTYHNAEQMFTDEIQIDGEWFRPLKKAPQNMMYVYDYLGDKYVLISVHPEWLAMILNGLKDVELRRKVLKEML